MRVRIVKRFHCDFCKKANLQERAMVNHEKFCTMNPNRKCRVCTLVNGGYGCDLKVLIALLPTAEQFHSTDFSIDNNYQKSVEDAMPALRLEADNCPACILSALRQAEVPVYMVDSFNYAEEMKQVFKVANEERYEGVSCY